MLGDSRYAIYWFPQPAVYSVTVLSWQLLEQYAEQVPWQSEIRHEAIRFPPMDKMIVDYQVSRNEENQKVLVPFFLVQAAADVGGV